MLRGSRGVGARSGLISSRPMAHPLLTVVALLSLTFGLSLGLTSCHKGEGTASPNECAGMCGKSTRCDGSKCVVDYSTDVCDGMSMEEEIEDMPPPISNWGACDVDPSTLPSFEPVDDSAIPAYDPKKATVLDMNAGSERLSDTQLAAQMRQIEHKINSCLSLASCHNNGLGSGTIGFEFRVTGKNGSVDGVNVTAPEELQVFGIVPCVRKAIADHTFPTFQGQQMVVNYSVELD